MANKLVLRNRDAIRLKFTPGTKGDTGDPSAPGGIGSIQLADKAVGDSKLRDSTALSVIGRSANSLGVPADIAAAVDGAVLRRKGSTLEFSKIEDANIGAPATPSGGVLSSKLRFDPGVTGPVVRTVQDALRDRHDLRDYNGLDLTGTNDNASLIQIALNDSSSNRSRLYAPAGIIVCASPINFTEGAVLEGRCLPAKSWNTTPSASDGFTWFHLAHTGKGFTLSSGPANQARARQISKIGTFRTQPEPVSLSPYTPNLGIDWDFYGEGVNDLIMDEIMLLNPTLGIGLIGSVAKDCGNARITMGRICGQPLKSGIQIEHCYDLHRIDSVHFWPFWRLTDEVLRYTNANSEAIISGRNDNPVWDGIFTFGYQRTLHFLQSSALGAVGANVPGGVTSNFQIGKVQGDSTDTAVVIDGNDVTGTIDDLIAWRSANWSPGGLTGTAPTALYALGNNADIGISSLRSRYAGRYHTLVAGTGNNISIGRSSTYSVDTGGVHYSVGSGNRVDIANRPVSDGSGAALGGGSGILSARTWFSYTPTVTAGAGAFGALGAVSASFRRIGDAVDVIFDIKITTNGTAANWIDLTLPIPAAGASCGIAREGGVTGAAIVAQVYNGTTTCRLATYNNAYPGGDGYLIQGQVTYLAG